MSLCSSFLPWPRLTSFLASDPATAALTTLVQAFLANVEHSSRFKAGDVTYSITWLPMGAVYQRKLENFVVSVLIAEGMNIGGVEDEMQRLSALLKPLI